MYNYYDGQYYDHRINNITAGSLQPMALNIQNLRADRCYYWMLLMTTRDGNGDINK